MERASNQKNGFSLCTPFAVAQGMLQVIRGDTSIVLLVAALPRQHLRRGSRFAHSDSHARRIDDEIP